MRRKIIYIRLQCKMDVRICHCPQIWMIEIDQLRQHRDKSKGVLKPLSNDRFFSLADIYESSRDDEIEQGPIDDKGMSDIVGAKHRNVRVHIRWLEVIHRDREKSFEFKVRRKTLPALVQFPFQLIRDFMVESIGTITRCYINKEVKRNVLWRVSFARCKTLRMRNS